jgi:hypothetical protein
MVGAGLVTVTVEVIAPGDGRTYHKSGPPSGTVTLQVGAFGDEENANKAKELLEAKRFKPVLESSVNGLTRVLLPGVPTRDVKLLRLTLADLGFSEVLVRH